MNQEVQSIIYLENNRKVCDFGKSTITDFVTINEVFLEPNVSYLSHSNSLIIPYIGDLTIDDEFILEEDQATYTNRRSLKITNTYDEDSIGLFDIQFNNLIDLVPNMAYSINFLEKLNYLIALSESICIGQFDGRVEGYYNLKSKTNHLIVYVISGAFEAQNRLLQPKEALVLWNLEVFEFEALSDGAIILIIEQNG